MPWFLLISQRDRIKLLIRTNPFYKLTAVILSIASAATAVASAAVASAVTAAATVAVQKNKSDYNYPEALAVLKEIT